MPIGAGAAETLRVAIVIETNAAVQLRAVGKEVDKFAARTNAKIGLASKTFTRLGQAVKGAGARMAAFAKRYTAIAGSIAGAAVIFRSVSDAQKFGLAIAEIGTIFDGTDEQLASVEQRILSLSETLGLAETIAAKGYYQIISADITDAADAMVVLEAGTKLATVGLADVKQTVDVLTSVIKAYARPVEDATDITNVLFRTVIKGKTTIPELSTSLGQVLPIAATLGIELEEVAAALATLTQGGIETNTAVIQMRQVFNQLIKPSNEALETMQQFGLAISPDNIRAAENGGLLDVLTQVEEKVGDNAGALAKLFGNIRGLIPILALAGKQSEQFRRVLGFVSEEADKGAESLEKFLQTPFKRIQVFFNSVRIQLRGVGEVFIRELSDQIGDIEGRITSVNALFGSMRGLASQAAKALGDVLDRIDLMIESLGGAEHAAEVLRKAGEALGSAIRAAFEAAFVAIQSFVIVLANLPRIINSLIAEVKKALNQIVPGEFLDPFANLSTEEAITELHRIGKEIVSVQERYEELNEFLLNDPRGAKLEFATDADIQRDPELQAFLRQQDLRNALEDRIEEMKLARKELQFLIDNPPLPTEDLVQLAFPGLDKLNTILGESKESLGEFYDLLAEKRAIGGFDFEGFFDLLRSALPSLDGGAVAISVELDEASRGNLFASLGELVNLAEDFSIEIPVEFSGISSDDVTVEKVRELVELIEQSGKLPTSLLPRGVNVEDFSATADGIRLVFTRSLEIVQQLDDALAGVTDTEDIRLELARRTFAIREKELKQALDLKNVTGEYRALFLALFKLAEDQKTADLFGFTDFQTEMERASRGLTDTIERQSAALDKNNAAILERADSLLDAGLIEEEQLKQIEGVIARVKEQFAEKKLQNLLGDEAFQGIDEAGRLFEDLERKAKAAALGIDEIPLSVAEIEFREVRDKFNAEMDKMTQGSEAFFDGFEAGWADTVRFMGDELRSGIETAKGVLDGFNSSLTNLLSARATGDLSSSEAWRAFREQLATSLADSVSQALADAFTSTLADTLAEVFGQKVKEKLSAEAIDAGAQAGFTAVKTAVGVPVELGEEAAEAATIATTVATTLTTELIPVISAWTGANSLAKLSAGLMGKAAIGHKVAAGLLTKAAAALKAASVTGKADGGVIPGSLAPATVKPFALGGFTRPIENLAVGGLKTRETFARIAEAGTNEAVVPLPGNGREIPVEFKNQPGSMRGGGGGDVHVTSHVVFQVSGGGGTKAEIVKHARDIENIVERAIVSGSNRGLKVAVRKAANGV